MSLPNHYLITPNPDNEEAFLDSLEKSLKAGCRLLQFKAKKLEDDAYRALAKKVIALTHHHGARVMLVGDPAWVSELGADGLHLDSKALAACAERPLPEHYLLAVSGHGLEALRKGESIGASFAVLSPINYTSAHPDIEPLGWEGIKNVTSKLSIPVYALGGVSAKDEDEAVSSGAQGIAGNRGYWQA